MTHEIFISYSRKDLAPVMDVKRKIDTLLNTSCWMDLKDIESGQDEFDETIAAAIGGSKVFLSMISSNAQQSTWFKKELRFAKEKEKKVVPVRFNGDPLSDVLKLNLAGTDIVDWRDPAQRCKLLCDLAKWLGKPKPDLSKEITYLGVPPSPRPKRRGVLWTTIVLLVAVAAFAAVKLVRAWNDDGTTDHPGLGTEEIGEASARGGEDDRPFAEGTDSGPESAPALPGSGARWTIALPGGAEMVFIPCSSGLFQMGSPEGEPGRYTNETIHIVRISRPFWIGETEVTQGQWRSLMGTSLDAQAQRAYEDETPIEIAGMKGTNRDFNYIEDTGELARLCGSPDDETAMYNVSWDDATNFCTRLTERERAAGRLPAGYVYRLPTEAEWEYAARAGKKASLPDGSDLDIEGCRNAPNLDSQGWYAGNSSVGFSGTGLDTSNWPEKQYPGGFAHARRVRQKAPNAWGLFDVIGNVFEWCRDYYGFCDYPAGFATDPVGPDNGTHRVVRGGSWISLPVGCCRLANRRGSWPNRRTIDYGFRVALAPEIE